LQLQVEKGKIEASTREETLFVDEQVLVKKSCLRGEESGGRRSNIADYGMRKHMSLSDGGSQWKHHCTGDTMTAAVHSREWKSSNVRLVQRLTLKRRQCADTEEGK
jgi:hypothetical protein